MRGPLVHQTGAIPLAALVGFDVASAGFDR
jgi:hypothetical protein